MGRKTFDRFRISLIVIDHSIQGLEFFIKYFVTSYHNYFLKANLDWCFSIGDCGEYIKELVLENIITEA